MRVLAVLVSLAVLSPAVADAPKPSEKVKKRLGEKAATLLDGATKVEVFRVGGELGAKPKGKTIASYSIIGTGKDQDEKFAAKLAGVILDEKTYEWEAAKGCIFNPGVAFRVWKGEESVVVVICFSCDQVRVAPVDKDGKVEKGVYANVDPGRAALLKLAKAALPDDKEIRQLKETR